MARGLIIPKVLSEREQKVFLSRFNRRYRSGLRNLTLCRLVLDTGLRAAEVVALRPEHLDLRLCRLIVREGKGDKDRVLWFSPDLRDLLGAWLERRPEGPYLFSTRDGDQISTRYLRAMVKKYAIKAGVSEADRVSPHTLRHTFATDLLRETRNLRLVQKALGHASITTTTIYTHIVDEEMEGALRNFRAKALRGVPQ